MKKTCKYIFMFLCIAALFTFTSMIVSASELHEIENKLEDFNFHTTSEGISMLDEAIPSTASVTRETNYLPKLKDGVYTKWIDRLDISYEYVNEYKRLETASNNDGRNDFLIDPSHIGSGGAVDDFPTVYYDEDGNMQNVHSRVYRYDVVKVKSADPDTIVDEFLEAVTESCYTMMTVYEAFLLDHPEVFWLSGKIYIDTSEPTVFQTNNGEYIISCNMYLTLNMWNEKGETVFDVRHPKYDVNTIRTTYYEIVQIADSIINKVKYSDDAAKIKYFNKYLTTHNEKNTYFDDSVEKRAELFNISPESYSCVSALRGVTGMYGPTETAYSFAFQFLCNHAGIPATLVFGTDYWNGPNDTRNWNYVQVDGKWYAVHCAWNDETSKKGLALSGDESEQFLLVGSCSLFDVNNLHLSYTQAFKAANIYASGLAYTNGPTICEDAFTYPLISLDITSSEQSFIYEYTDAPVIRSKAVVRGGNSGTPTYKWFLVDPNNNLKQFGIEGSCSKVQPGIYDCTTTFPEVTQPGVYRIISEVALAGRTKRSETSVEVTIFQDVNESHWYYNAVDWAIENGITYGLNNASFGPAVSCTRAQIVTFLWRAAGSPEPVSTENHFKDVLSDAYYYKAVLWAVENGITSGYSSDEFAPDNSCTRGEMVTFLWRAGGKEEARDKVHPYKDVKGDGFYYEAMLWAVEEGIAAGYTAAKFAPFATVTRAETVTFLYRANGNPIPTQKKDGPSGFFEIKEAYDEDSVLYYIPNDYIEKGHLQSILPFYNDLLIMSSNTDETRQTVNKIAVLDMNTGEPIQEFELRTQEPLTIQVLEDTIAATDYITGKIYFLDSGLKIIKEIDCKYEDSAQIVNHDATKIYYFLSDGIYLYDISKDKSSCIYKNKIKPYDISVSGNFATLIKVDESTGEESNIILDIKQEKIIDVELPFYLYDFTYNDEVWTGDGYFQPDRKYIGIKDQTYVLKFPTTDAWLFRSNYQNRYFVKIRTSDENLQSGISLYETAGTFISKFEIPIDGNRDCYQCPIWFERDNGYYFIFTDIHGTDILMYWDISVPVEGKDLELELYEN